MIDRAKCIRKHGRILGIFGGMGPEATVDFYAEIIRLTPATRDQDHIPTLIYSLPQVPDRTVCIQNNDRSIIPYLIEAVKRLEAGGATFICIPCNTVHYFYEDMNKAVSIPILHMIHETVKAVRADFPEIHHVGILATAGTIESGVYGNAFISNGFHVVVPDDDVENEKVMKAVYGIKAGTEKRVSEDLLAKAADHLIQKGARLIVLGCTEIPLAFNPNRVDVPVVNATRVLARAAIRMFYKEVI